VLIFLYSVDHHEQWCARKIENPRGQKAAPSRRVKMLEADQAMMEM
jgi:hypothetical protein